MKWLTRDELLVIHARVIDETGGAAGILIPGAVESALLRPLSSFGGIEVFAGLIAKIAAMIHSIIQFHPFVDGNKRTALVAADVCLRLNGFRLSSSEEVEPFFWSIARGEQDVPAIAEWLGKHVAEFDPG